MKTQLYDMHDAAKAIFDGCAQSGFPEDKLEIMQVLCLSEECGEVVGAYRRWAGLARRSGPFAHIIEELADVVISANVVAYMLSINLDVAIDEKLANVFTRGWRKGTPDKVET